MTIHPRAKDQPLRIVCTDKGCHRRTQLAYYWLMVDGSDRVTNHAFTLSVLGPGDYEPEGPLSTVSKESYTFWCPRCGRNPKIRLPLTKFAQAYQSGLVDCLDISRLNL